MMADGSLVNEKIGLIMADFHTGGMGVNPLVRETQTFEGAAEVLQDARNSGIFVAYVVVNFRVDYPEISDRNLSF